MGHVRDLPASADEIPPSYKDKDWANLGVNVEKGRSRVKISVKGS